MPKRDSTLLRAAFLTAIPEEPSQYDQVDPKFMFLPAAHFRALEPSAMLVKGIRGAGKSFWWHALQNDNIRRVVLLGNVTTSAGFGEGDGQDRPDRDVLAEMLDAGHEPRLIWKAVALRHFIAASGIDIELPSQWRELAEWVRDDAQRVADLLRRADQTLAHRNQTHVVLFDALDRTAASDGHRQALLRGLLELVLELRPRACLRAKIFARPDMLDHPDVRTFPDASKVLTTAVQLDWSRLDLYGLLFTYLGNGSEDAAAEFRTLTRDKWKEDVLGWQLPNSLRTDAEEQARVFVLLAGPHMGTNPRRGMTYPWLPNHIGDAHGKVSPRSFLAAMRRAAETPPSPGQGRALTWRGLHAGVRAASDVRAGEIKDDLAWAYDAMTALRDLVVPCEQEKVLGRWKKNTVRSPIVALKELIRAGVIAEMPEGKLNVPDLYRVGFGLRRKGGLAPT